MTNIIKHRNDMPHKRSSWCDVDGVIHMSSSWRRTQWKASMWSLAIVHEVVHLCRKKKLNNLFFRWQNNEKLNNHALTQPTEIKIREQKW